MVLSVCPKCSRQFTEQSVRECPGCGATLNVVSSASDDRLIATQAANRLTTQPCPEPNELERYLRDQLSPAEEQSVESHVEQCIRCERRLAEQVQDEQDEAPEARSQSWKVPSSIGRYQLRELLGSGGFGDVYLAEDELLQRTVAIKIPHRVTHLQRNTVDDILTEARVLAQVEHPNIVSVFDFGQMDDGRYFIVSQYIAGDTLKSFAARHRLSWQEAASLVAQLADGAHAAHRKRLVHRDIKPANILVDQRGVPYLTDFGLALRDVDYGDPAWQGGTLSYLSPEQARAEGHLVDGRADVFSLGVVLYELITGEVPFRAHSAAEMLERIQHTEPRPVRQIIDDLPAELERICLKCLAKSLRERYTTAADLARDLRRLLQQNESSEFKSRKVGKAALKPRGLRAFEPQDHRFYIDLLPGQRDFEGLPESVAFWKRRIASQDPHESFRIGLVYGPSGSGKTSLVRAGLIPNLPTHVTPVYVAAQTQETEWHLLRALRNQLPAIAEHESLVGAIAALRRELSEMTERKTLIVIDQMEQWFHGADDRETLTNALRQCDGTHVQGLLLVRDEYWMEATRFLDALDVALQADNCHTVDLFDVDHARHVLIRFGRAYERLPSHDDQLSRDQQQFVTQCVAELANRDNRVIPVHLAMMAEMTKTLPWTPQSLRQVGGPRGLGTAYLDSMFSPPMAPPQNRLQRRAAQNVLRALLPPGGTSIRGHGRARSELFAFSECESTQQFDRLMDLLDRQLRLVTPTGVIPSRSRFRTQNQLATRIKKALASPFTWERGKTRARVESKSGRRENSGSDPPETQGYQLTHDYLVPSVREWLAREDRRTFRGRARQLLQDRANLWSVWREKRQLPSALETTRIVLGTRSAHWMPAERQMMRQAMTGHGKRLVIVSIIATLLAALGLSARTHILQQNARVLTRRLVEAQLEQIPALVNQLASLGPVAKQIVSRSDEHRELVAPNQLDWRDIAAVRITGTVSPESVDQLLHADPEELFVVQQIFAGKLNPELRQQLNNVLHDDSDASLAEKLRAASILSFSGETAVDMSPETVDEITSELIARSPSRLPQWLRYLQTSRRLLELPLLRLYLKPSTPSQQRHNAALALRTLYPSSANVLATLAVYESDDLFSDIMHEYVRLDDPDPAHFENMLAQLVGVFEQSERSHESMESVVKRASRAACALVILSRESRVWPLLVPRKDPRLRARLIASMARLDVPPRPLIDYLRTARVQPDLRAALLLALGQYDRRQIPPDSFKPVITLLRDIYKRDPSAAAHAAAGWVMQQWGIDRRSIRQTAQSFSAAEANHKGWFAAPDDSTMVVLGPDMFWMGSPATSAERLPTEVLHRRQLNYRFAIAATEVTVGQYRDYLTTQQRAALPQLKEVAPDTACPQVLVTWDEAVNYCNWLSAKAGLQQDQWCYERVSGRGGDGRMRPAANVLQRRGYRLPTEAEWEYACRAGTTTTWFHGETSELLSDYGWYGKEKVVLQPVGRLMPNPFGLFDVYGNALEWCHSRLAKYRDARDNPEQGWATVRVQRGGHILQPAKLVRSAIRYNDPHNTRNYVYGFRIAKSVVLSTLDDRSQ